VSDSQQHYAFLGWQGFGLEHPAEWELNRVRGSRKSSYLAFDDGERVRMEINWKPVRRKVPVEQLVDKQVKVLEATAKRRRIDIELKRRQRVGRVRNSATTSDTSRMGTCGSVKRC